MQEKGSAMESGTGSSRATQTCFVYSRQTGEVVHIHQFVPAEPDGRISDEAMEETALKLAPASFDRAGLAVLHRGADLDLTSATRYRVDVEGGELVEEPVPDVSIVDMKSQER